MLDHGGMAGRRAQPWLRGRMDIPRAEPDDKQDHLLRLVQRTLGTGMPLGDEVRRRVESWFGRNLGDVRVHDSAQAAALARRLGAEAFTIKSHIFGAAESLNAKTTQGRGLLAHEMTHVIQQTDPDHIPEHPNDGVLSQFSETPRRHGRWEQRVWGPAAASRVESSYRSPVHKGERSQRRQPTVDRVSLQVSEDIVQRATEGEAQINEVLASSASGEQVQSRSESPKRAPGVDVNEVAAKVQHLMVEDLIIERERGALAT